jgi:Uncharacterised protein family (UPF0259)
MYKAHWRHLVPLAAIFYVGIAAVTLALTALFGFTGAALAGVVSLVGFFWLAGSLVEAIADVRDGRADLTLGQTIQRVRPRLFVLLGAGLLVALGVIVGLLLLVIPGLVLLTWWSMVPAVVVLERAGVMESFGRSRELVRGHGWRVFAVIVITFVIVQVVRNLLGAALSWLPDWLAYFLADAVGSSFTAPFAALAITLMYFRLARLRAGVEPSPVPAV